MLKHDDIKRLIYNSDLEFTCKQMPLCRPKQENCFICAEELLKEYEESLRTEARLKTIRECIEYISHYDLGAGDILTKLYIKELEKYLKAD